MMRRWWWLVRVLCFFSHYITLVLCCFLCYSISFPCLVLSFFALFSVIQFLISQTQHQSCLQKSFSFGAIFVADLLFFSSNYWYVSLSTKPNNQTPKTLLWFFCFRGQKLCCWFFRSPLLYLTVVVVLCCVFFCGYVFLVCFGGLFINFIDKVEMFFFYYYFYILLFASFSFNNFFLRFLRPISRNSCFLCFELLFNRSFFVVVVVLCSSKYV